MPDLKPGQLVRVAATWSRPEWCREDWCLIQVQSREFHVPNSVLTFALNTKYCWIKCKAQYVNLHDNDRWFVTFLDRPHGTTQGAWIAASELKPLEES